MDDRYGNEVDLDSIEDEKTLLELLEETDDFDEKKMIRARLREVQQAKRSTAVKGSDIVKQRENEREDALRRKQRESEEKKKRTLAMYDNMAKSAPAGGHKTMDINIYKNATPSQPTGANVVHSGNVKQRDLVEEGIRDRVKAADDRKLRMLAAFDAAAKAGPAGTIRDVNFEEFKRADVSDFTPPKPVGSCTFGMSGGVPQVVKAPSSRPGTPGSPGFGGAPKFEEVYVDPVERALRERVRQSDENKRRLLAAYDYVAKSGGCGPKVVCLEEFKNMQIPDDYQMGSKHNATSGFKGGVPRRDNPNVVNPKSGPAAAYHDGTFTRK